MFSLSAHANERTGACIEDSPVYHEAWAALVIHPDLDFLPTWARRKHPGIRLGRPSRLAALERWRLLPGRALGVPHPALAPRRQVVVGNVGVAVVMKI